MPRSCLAAALLLIVGDILHAEPWAGEEDDEGSCTTPACAYEDAVFLQVPQIVPRAAGRLRVTAGGEESATAPSGENPTPSVGQVNWRPLVQEGTPIEQFVQEAVEHKVQEDQQQLRLQQEQVERELELLRSFPRKSVEEQHLAQPPRLGPLGPAPPVEQVQPRAPSVPTAPPPTLATRLTQWLGLEYSTMGLVKAACVVGNVLSQASSAPQVRTWSLRGHTGSARAGLVVATAFSACQWCFYGFYAWVITGVPGFLLLVRSNALGAALGCGSVAAFLRFCQEPAQRARARTYLVLCAIFVTIEVAAVLTQVAERALLVAGLVSTAGGFMIAGAMLEAVPGVLAERNARAINGPAVVAHFLCSCCWVACGLLLDDLLLAAPSAACVVASGACAVLKVAYPSSEDVPPASPRQRLKDALEQMGASLAKLEEEASVRECCNVPFALNSPFATKRGLGNADKVSDFEISVKEVDIVTAPPMDSVAAVADLQQEAEAAQARPQPAETDMATASAPESLAAAAVGGTECCDTGGTS